MILKIGTKLDHIKLVITGRYLPSIRWQPGHSLRRDSAVSTVTSLHAYDSCSDAGSTLFSLLRSVTSVLGLVSACSLGSGGEAEHYCPSSTEVNNEWSNTSNPTYTFLFCKVTNFSLVSDIVGLLSLQEPITAVYAESKEDSVYCYTFVP